MGRVWVAEHQTLETEVAVKLLNPDLAQDEQWLNRFRREAQAIAQIDSAHVVRVFDHGVTEDGVPYIVMELMRGEDLRTRLERNHGLPIDEAVLVVAQTCKALSRAHALGIVHRDVKPENIFLTQEGSDTFVKILDFGIAKRVSGKGMDVTDEHSVFGTPYYMSPEQALSTGNVDHRTDLWALAVVAFQMLTGERPFTGSTPGAIYVQINAGIFRLPSEMRPGIPKAVDEWFKTALNRDLDSRFSSAEEMSRAFRLALNMSVDTPRTSAFAAFTKTQTSTDSCGAAAASVRMGRHLRTRTPRRTIIAGLLLIGVAFVTWLGRRSDSPQVGLPSAAQRDPIGNEAIERTAGLRTASLPVPLATASGALRDLPIPTGASASAIGNTDLPADGNAATTKRPDTRPPPAQAMSREVKGRGALVSPSSSSPATELANPRPIKDRGF